MIIISYSGCYNQSYYCTKVGSSMITDQSPVIIGSQTAS